MRSVQLRIEQTASLEPFFRWKSLPRSAHCGKFNRKQLKEKTELRHVSITMVILGLLFFRLICFTFLRYQLKKLLLINMFGILKTSIFVAAIQEMAGQQTFSDRLFFPELLTTFWWFPAFYLFITSRNLNVINSKVSRFWVLRLWWKEVVSSIYKCLLIFFLFDIVQC